jgi:hypothetical protein
VGASKYRHSAGLQVPRIPPPLLDVPPVWMGNTVLTARDSLVRSTSEYFTSTGTVRVLESIVYTVLESLSKIPSTAGEKLPEKRDDLSR